MVQPDTSREAFLADCREGGRFSAVEGIYRHNTSTDWIGLFDSELVAALPKGLSVIGHNGAGYGRLIQPYSDDHR